MIGSLISNCNKSHLKTILNNEVRETLPFRVILAIIINNVAVRGWQILKVAFHVLLLERCADLILRHDRVIKKTHINHMLV